MAAKSLDGSRPHVLVMTATPIPRTVAMTVFGDVEVSVLAELPSGRLPIATHVVGAEQPRLLDRAWARVREEAGQGHRVFVVCPRIGEDASVAEPEATWGADEERPTGDGPPGSSVLELARSLGEGELAGLRIGVLHGRMAAEDKEDAMRRFSDTAAADGIDVLVSTTVIEVGVDVPQATMMVIMDADRFGISQLHQLRGRVGRGGLPSLCLLVTSAEDGSPARERLAAVAATTDGFELSELDLQLRREGDVLGSSQSGVRSSLRLLEVARHGDVIAAAQDGGHVPGGRRPHPRRPSGARGSGRRDGGRAAGRVHGEGVTRIIAGAARGRRLAVPGSGTRPTSDRVREALFSALESEWVARGITWPEVTVLDLFAGTGALGLEALSRGATRAQLVERARPAARTLAANVAAVGCPGAEVVTRDVAQLAGAARPDARGPAGLRRPALRLARPRPGPTARSSPRGRLDRRRRGGRRGATRPGPREPVPGGLARAASTPVRGHRALVRSSGVHR